MLMSKKKLKPGPMTVKAATIMAECAFATGQGLERAMAGRKYAIDPLARDFWLNTYVVTIRLALKSGVADWEGSDRDDVIPRSMDLGMHAAKAALKGAGNAAIVLVTEAHAREGSKTVSKDRRCQAARRRAQKT